ncbi:MULTISPECIES: nucleotide disphospho-sugar-binding domain-containing protein [unclassified Micromonospora]|uniref:nucleotide disphospho-sugar-binding domain-containing protein n=1 Tax=unclassified Micromonospora TaxID=2617518 RepID=UPI0033E6CA75
MRILVLNCPSKTHLYALTPLAWALRTAGHEVRMATQPDPVGLTPQDVAHTGLTAVSLGTPIDLTAMVSEKATEEEALPVPDADAGPYENGRKSVQADYAADDPLGELTALADWHFTIFNPDSVIDDAVRFARAWKPDLVLWDGMTMAYAGPVAARACGAAHARLVMCTDALMQLRTAARAVDPARDPMRVHLEPILARYGLDFTEESVTGQWSVNAMPPWTWQPEGIDYQMVRAVPFNGPSIVPEWLYAEPDRRRVCLTLGLSFRELNAGASVSDMLDAVADLDAEVIVTLTDEQRAALPALPGNVRPVPFVPLNALLPTCSAIVHHGGYGTVAAATYYGVPQLLVPGKFGADKFWGPLAVVTALEEQGAGVYVSDPGRLTAEALHNQLRRVLDSPSYGRNAERLRARTAAVPSPNDVVPQMEKLATVHRAG